MECVNFAWSLEYGIQFMVLLLLNKSNYKCNSMLKTPSWLQTQIAMPKVTIAKSEW